MAQPKDPSRIYTLKANDQWIPLQQLHERDSVKPRGGLSDLHVAACGDILDNYDPGEWPFEPLEVAHLDGDDPGTFTLVCGHTRYHAARLKGRAQVVARPLRLTLEQAQSRAILDNCTHGEGYSKGDLGRNIRRLLQLKMYAHTSDREIARLLRCNQSYVSDLHTALRAEDTVAEFFAELAAPFAPGALSDNDHVALVLDMDSALVKRGRSLVPDHLGVHSLAQLKARLVTHMSGTSGTTRLSYAEAVDTVKTTFEKAISAGTPAPVDARLKRQERDEKRARKAQGAFEDAMYDVWTQVRRTLDAVASLGHNIQGQEDTADLFATLALDPERENVFLELALEAHKRLGAVIAAYQKRQKPADA